MLKQLLHRLNPRGKDTADLAAYLAGGRRPWSRGYQVYKEQFIARHLSEAFLQARATDDVLPQRYGEFLDERVVEYPWLMSRLAQSPSRLLDAGSSLNHAYLLDHPRLRIRNLSIVTLAPEQECYWQRGISYAYADLRELPFRDDFFDEVVSVSTIEHVGKENRFYTTDRRFSENDNEAFQIAVRELRRVCRPGGKVYITLPFGRYTDFGWYQQFDSELVDRLLDVFVPARVKETCFRYAQGGWHISDRSACRECEGFDIHATRYKDPRSRRDYDADFAAASRAIVALELWKGKP
jgi:SAM-dependent methyltransferase